MIWLPYRLKIQVVFKEFNLKKFTFYFFSSSFWPEYLTKLQVALNDFRKAFLTRAVMSYITKVKLLLQQEIHIVQRGRSQYNSYSLLRTKFFSRLVTKAFFFQWVRDRRKKKRRNIGDGVQYTWKSSSERASLQFIFHRELSHLLCGIELEPNGKKSSFSRSTLINESLFSWLFSQVSRSSLASSVVINTPRRLLYYFDGERKIN